MKIGILSERLIKGYGVDLVIHNQANGLVEKGYEVTVYVLRYEEDAFLDKKYSVVVVDSPLMFNPFKTEFFLLKRKLKFFRKQNNDFWFTHSWPMNVLTPFLKGKVFIVDHGTVSTEGMYLKKKLAFWYQRYMSQFIYFSFARKILSISNYMRSQLPFFIRWKAIVSYNGADHYTKEYEKDTTRVKRLKKELGIDKNNIVMLYVGRLNHNEQPYKGVNDLIEIYAESKRSIPKLKLIMAGFGSEQDVKELGKYDVIALNNVSNDTLLDLFYISDFYVSATKWEGFNLPMIEAQSFGKLPILYNIGPHSEITNNNVDSIIVENQSEFIKSIINLSKDKKKREESDKLTKLNAEKYTWQKSINTLDKLIKNEL